MYFEITGTKIEKLGKEVVSTLQKIEVNGLENATVELVAAQFPGGTAADQECITLCNDAIKVVQTIDAKLPGAIAAIRGISNDLKAAILQVKEGKTKKNLGYYLHIIGAVIATLANDL